MDEVLGEDVELAIEAYRVLRDRARAVSRSEADANGDDVDAEERATWRRFPVHPDEAVDEDTWPAIQKSVEAWWQAWLDARRAAYAEGAGGRDG